MYQLSSGRHDARIRVGGKRKSFGTYLAVELAALNVATVEQEIATEKVATNTLHV